MTELKRGTIIEGIHEKSNLPVKYTVVLDVDSGCFKLISQQFKIMSGFKAQSLEDCLDYINNGLKCKIVKVT